MYQIQTKIKVEREGSLTHAYSLQNFSLQNFSELYRWKYNHNVFSNALLIKFLIKNAKKMHKDRIKPFK